MRGSCMASWLMIAALLALPIFCLPARAADNGPGSAEAFIPTFQDPLAPLELPDTFAASPLRIITGDDYPPFHFTGQDGTLTGLNVDLARALCDELKIACTIQVRRWDTMTGALVQGEADVAIASMAISAQAREVLDFTLPVYQTPGRFVVRLGEAVPDRFVPETLAGRPVGVAAGSAHQAFLEKFFPRTPLRAYPTLAALYSALKREEVPIIFADGIASAIWLASADPQDCCAMAPGAWSHSAFFGEGAGIAMAKGRPALRQALNYALQRLAVRRVWSEIYLKYFPVGFY